MEGPIVEAFQDVQDTIVSPYLEFNAMSQDIFHWLEAYRENIKKNVLEKEEYKNLILPKTPIPKRKLNKNESPNDAVTSTTKSDTDVTTDSSLMSGYSGERSQRNASKLASTKITNLNRIALNAKLRRPDNKENYSENIYLTPDVLKIKVEQVSPEKTTALNDTTNVMMMMPPPTEQPKRIRRKIKKEPLTESESETEVHVTRSKSRGQKTTEPQTVVPVRITRSRMKKEIVEEPLNPAMNVETKSKQNSDVYIQEVSIPVVEISDSDGKQTESETDKKSDKSKRTKRGRPKKKKATMTKETNENGKDVSVYEDALSINNDNNMNFTFDVIHKTGGNDQSLSSVLNNTQVINNLLTTPNIDNLIKNKQISIMDCTVVLNRLSEKQQSQEKVPNIDSLLTDDDSIEIPKESVPIQQNKGIKTKAIFSPYANSPVRKRVAAFEQLTTTTTSTTRTRSKLLQTKFETPSAKPLLFTQTEKLNRVKQTDFGLKSASAVKPSRTILEERKAEEQKRRHEKEEEVKRKKDAMLHAKTEEQRRKREEKQIRAQKAREAIEREKEEKLRQMIQEKNEKQLEEQQKKREWLLKKAEEKRNKMEEAKMKMIEARKKQEEEQRRLKLAQGPPPLPTDDWEDSDSSSSSNHTKSKPVPPAWAQPSNLHSTLLTEDRHIPQHFIEKFFQMRACTPNLRRIFTTIDESALRRNSSAIWNTPPHY